MAVLLSAQKDLKVLRSLTWSLMWILSRPALEYLLLQFLKVQANGFWPVWVNSCAYKCPLVMN